VQVLVQVRVRVQVPVQCQCKRRPYSGLCDAQVWRGCRIAIGHLRRLDAGAGVRWVAVSTPIRWALVAASALSIFVCALCVLGLLRYATGPRDPRLLLDSQCTASR
jgi:hypothetical protein